MTLGERIALARKKAGLSQEQLGDRLGVSRQAVSKWESSQANPDVAYVAELCRVCGVSCDWLLLGEEGAREAPPARCGSCGAIVTGLDRYCPQCGHPLQKEEADTYSLVLVDPRKNLTAAFDGRSWCRSPRCRPSPSPARSPAGLPCPSGPRWERCFWGCWPPCWCSPCFEAGREKTAEISCQRGRSPVYCS